MTCGGGGVSRPAGYPGQLTRLLLCCCRADEAVFVKHLQSHVSRFNLLRVTPSLLKAALTFRHGSSGHRER